MGASAIAIVGFLVMLMLAATVAVLTVIYATRLPSKRAVPPKARVAGDAGPEPGEIPVLEKAVPGVPGSKIPMQTGAAGELSAPPSIAGPKDAEGPSRVTTSKGSETEQPMNIFSSKRASNVPSSPVADGAPSLSVRGVTAPAPAAAHEPASKAGQNPQDQNASPPPPDGSPVGLQSTAATQQTPSVDAKPAAPGGRDPQDDRLNKTTGPIAANEKPLDPPAPAAKPAQSATDAKSPEKAAEVRKSAAIDMSDLFVKAATEESKVGKLAELVPDVDINDILKQGQTLARSLKKK